MDGKGERMEVVRNMTWIVDENIRSKIKEDVSSFIDKT